MFKVALHEAGHARVAMHYGFDAETWIEPDPQATGRLGVSRSRFPEATPESKAADEYVTTVSPGERARLLDMFLMNLATIALAGPEAERLLAPNASESDIEAASGSDRDRAATVIWDRSDSPRLLHLNLNRAAAEARALVRKHAAEIMLIACELMERKRLSAGELRAVVGSLSPDDRHVSD